VYRVGADGGGVRQLIGADRAPIQRLEWSPDGRRLGYAGRFDEAGRGAVYIVDAETSTWLRLTEPETANACRATWSPDGSRLAFDAGADGCEGALGIWVVGVNGSMPRQLTGLATHDLFPAWSPDATRIAFTRSTGADSLTPSDLFVVRSDGSGLAQVTDGGRARLFGFAPGPLLRLSGPSRVDTALAVSRQVHDGADTIVLASVDGYADALAGAPLAGALQAPLLLTPGDRLHPAVAAEAARLGATTAYLLGGEAALSTRISDDLQAAGVPGVVRVGGRMRFETARLVAEALAPDATAAYLAEGAHADPTRGWPDAVAVSALAAFQRRPVLLTEQDRIPEDTLAALRMLDLTEITVVGGPSAVSSAVADAVAAEGITVRRIAGDTRYATSVAVAGAALEAGADPTRVWVERSELARCPDGRARGDHHRRPAPAHGWSGSARVPAVWRMADRPPGRVGATVPGRRRAGVTPAVQVTLLRAASG
jgi:hypothetical protein